MGAIFPPRPERAAGQSRFYVRFTSDCILHGNTPACKPGRAFAVRQYADFLPLRRGQTAQRKKSGRTFVLPLFDGKSTARGYNAPCFERMVHYFMGSVLMRRDNEDRKDNIKSAYRTV